MNDSMTREVSAIAALGASSASFKNPSRALVIGEWITFSGHSTEYRVTSSTSTSVSFTPVLDSAVADNETITRYDKYAVISVEDWLDENGIETEEDSKKAFVYKKILSARSRVETRLCGPIVSRTFSEKYSVNTWEVETNAIGYSGAQDRRILYLKNSPIISITSLTIDDTLIDSTDYEIAETERGIFYDGGFPKGKNHIDVEYVAGYTYPEFEFRELVFNVTNMLIALSPQGKDLLIVGSNNGATGQAINQSIRTLEDIDNYIDMHIGKYARINV